MAQDVQFVPCASNTKLLAIGCFHHVNFFLSIMHLFAHTISFVGKVHTLYVTPHLPHPSQVNYLSLFKT